MDFGLSSEQQALVELAARLGRDVFAAKAARWDRDHQYPHENVEDMIARSIFPRRGAPG